MAEGLNGELVELTIVGVCEDPGCDFKKEIKLTVTPREYLQEGPNVRWAKANMLKALNDHQKSKHLGTKKRITLDYSSS